MKMEGHIKTLLDRAHNSWRGLRQTVSGEQSFRYELTLAAIAAPVALWVAESLLEIALLLGSLLILLIIELLNTAIETCIDYISTDTHPMAARAKDIGSCAVAFGLILVALIWSLILYPKFA